MKWLIILILFVSAAHAKTLVQYPYPFGEQPDYRDRLLLPHIYPGQTITSVEVFNADPLRPGTSTVRWTKEGAFRVMLDKVHLLRDDYTLFIKSRHGPEIRQLPFQTTKLYLRPDYYKIRFQKETNTVWLAKYAD